MNKLSAFLTAMVFFLSSDAQTHSSAKDSLYNGFVSPGNAAKPRVWWHWMNGNITKEGIQKDLDWMKRIGIGGFQNFDANLFTPVVVSKKLVFMTPEWKEAFRFATELADKNGLEMAIAGSPGWSVTGGPWVTPQDGMKKYVWTETRVSGGQVFRGNLSQPKTTTGKFQNAGASENSLMGGTTGKLPTYYADAAVIAYRLLPADKTLSELKPKISSSGGNFNLKDLTDGDLSATNFLPPRAVGDDMWIQFEFDTPQTFKAFSVSGASHTAMEDFQGGPLNRALKVSDDGVNFREVAKISGSIVPQNTVSIPPTTAKYFRFTFKTLPGERNLFAAMAGGPQEEPKPKGIDIAEIVLHTTDRVDQFEDKAGFSPWKEDTKTFVPSNADAIADEVIDLTDKMKADGSLEWNVPQGNWMILRFGYSLTGRQNHPASPEATGLEVDKLDKEAVRKYINTYLDMYKDATGGLMGARGIQYMILDSYEAGHMTWTKSFPEEFLKRRGYEIKKWIPVLTGRIVTSAEASEKFLWDFRKTIGELIVENHYDVIGEELHKRGMKRYTESQEDKRIYLADGMDVKRYSDIPMSAMWIPGSLASGPDEEIRSEADIRESASVAHIYGKEIVAAESLTSIQNAFSFHPEKLKRTADLELASGLNRFVIHTSVHQPLDDKKPGFSLGPFGQYFTRHETWAEQAKPWIDYLARSSYLLQKGRFVADVLYLYGENTNLTWQFKDGLPSIPGYEYDFCNSSALINVMQAKNRKIITPSGMSYSLLIIDSSARFMTLPVLKKIRDLVEAGVKVAGVRPEKSPSLSDDNSEFQSIVQSVWGGGNTAATVTQNYHEVLRDANIVEDVIIRNAKSKIFYVHRQTKDQDIYWLNNRSVETNEAQISFRVSGKVPELWNPQTGKKERVSYQIKDGRTIVPLRFESWDAYFIIFSDKASANSYTRPNATEAVAAEITNPWKVDFNGKKTTFENLTSWSDNSDTEIKYFSGTAVYENSFKLNTKNKGSYLIDLGDVKNIAEVFVNGRNMGTIWKQPFLLDITNALKSGNNTIQVKVTNLWVNRLIGDSQPDVKIKTTFTTMPFYRADAKLLPSGLLGPVKIKSVVQ
ncbi:glycosyl hydrolase [Pollutibacter soli]|uniref:glycosyl hydrolase n=1 Tax=Pollutibacter soli TaxID=3034157 RepID=UPI0030139287